MSTTKSPKGVGLTILASTQGINTRRLTTHGQENPGLRARPGDEEHHPLHRRCQWEASSRRNAMRTEVVAREGATKEADGDHWGGRRIVMNKIIIIGNLGRDPELRYTPTAQIVTSFSVATNLRE